LLRALAANSKELSAIAADVYAHRRWPCSDLSFLREGPLTACLIRAVGRMQEQAWISRLHQAWESDGSDFLLEIGIALLRLGQKQHLEKFLQQAVEQDDLHLVVGLGGDELAAQVIEQRVAGQPSPHACLALGLLGSSGSVSCLIDALSDEAAADQAALALFLLTGARLEEEVFIEEPVDPDSLFENEDSSAQEPQGDTLTRLSQKPGDWQAWWATNKSRFRPAVRYRLGKPFSPHLNVEILESPTSAHLLRQLTVDELAIRYGFDCRIDVSMFVDDQKKSIDQLKQQMASSSRSLYHQADGYR
jgi:hypothetical protein